MTLTQLHQEPFQPPPGLPKPGINFKTKPDSSILHDVGLLADLDAPEVLDSDALENLMETFLAREADIFGDHVASSALRENHTSTRPRANVVSWFRNLLDAFDLSDEVPSALTLLDALQHAERQQSRQQPIPLAQNQEMLSITLMAIVQILVKLRKQTDANDVIRRLQNCGAFSALLPSLDGKDSTHFHVVIQATNFEELRIVALLKGQVHLFSAVKWAAVIACRLGCWAAAPWAKGARKAWPFIRHWSEKISEQIVARNSLPPKALGVAACVLGLALSKEVKLDQSLQKSSPPCSGHDGDSHFEIFSVEIVALAACCDVEDVRKWTFEVPLIIAHCYVGEPKPLLASNFPLISEEWPAPIHASCAEKSKKTICHQTKPSRSDISTNVERVQQPSGDQDSQEQKSEADTIVTLLVSKFPRTALPADLHEAFRGCAEAESAEIVLDRRNCSRCYGFVRFGDEAAAKRAYKACKEENISMKDEEGQAWKMSANFAKQNSPMLLPIHPGKIFACRSDWKKNFQLIPETGKKNSNSMSLVEISDGGGQRKVR